MQRQLCFLSAAYSGMADARITSLVYLLWNKCLGALLACLPVAV